MSTNPEILLGFVQDRSKHPDKLCGRIKSGDKMKKNSLMEKSHVRKALPRNVQSMRLDDVVVHKL